MDSKTLNELQKETISLESSMIDYLSKIEDINKEIGNEIKIENIYLKIYSELDIKLKEIEKYIESSKKEEKVKEEISDNTENIQLEEVKIDDNQVETEKIEEKENIETAEIITLYEVFSDKSIENMKNIISDLEKRMDELNIVYKQEKNAVIDENNKEKEEKIENVETKDKEEKEIKEKYKDLTNEEIEKEVKEIIKKYNEFLKYEYTFYLDNINSLLKVTNEKIKNISSVTETDILSEVKYVYIDLPVNLDKYLDTYNVDSKIEIKYLISNLKDELNVLRNNYLNLQKIYDELKVNDLLNNA